jgi:hypothetical protein
MSEVIKFTQEEMDEVFTLQQDYNEVLLTIGKIELERMSLQKRMKDIEEAKEKLTTEKFGEFEVREKLFLEKITTKYGEGSLSLKDGTFTPAESKPAQG